MPKRKSSPNVTPGFGRKPVEKPIIRLDLGCGPNKKEGFIGVDIMSFGGKVDALCDLRLKTWFFEKGKIPGLKPSQKLEHFPVVEGRGLEFMLPDESVLEVHCSHFIEHLEAHERVHFINELHRVLVPGGKCTLIAPYAFSERAYGDLTHKWPPVVGFWFYYLDKAWRAANAPHSGYNEDVDFAATWGYSLHQSLAGRNQEYVQNAILYYKEACQDIQSTLEKKVKAPATT